MDFLVRRFWDRKPPGLSIVADCTSSREGADFDPFAEPVPSAKTADEKERHSLYIQRKK
jgi:hypothetical protein